MKVKVLGFLALILLLFTIIACGGSTTTTRTTSSLPPGPPDVVEVTYFYESEACFRLELASEWIDTTITNDYKAQLDSGKLTYIRYDTHTVNGLWLYTDITGENEMLKSKFISLLKSKLDKSLTGE